MALRIYEPTSKEDWLQKRKEFGLGASSAGMYVDDYTFYKMEGEACMLKSVNRHTYVLKKLGVIPQEEFPEYFSKMGEYAETVVSGVMGATRNGRTIYYRDECKVYCTPDSWNGSVLVETKSKKVSDKHTNYNDLIKFLNNTSASLPIGVTRGHELFENHYLNTGYFWQCQQQMAVLGARECYLAVLFMGQQWTKHIKRLFKVTPTTAIRNQLIDGWCKTLRLEEDVKRKLNNKEIVYEN